MCSVSPFMDQLALTRNVLFTTKRHLDTSHLVFSWPSAKLPKVEATPRLCTDDEALATKSSELMANPWSSEQEGLAVDLLENDNRGTGFTPSVPGAPPASEMPGRTSLPLGAAEVAAGGVVDTRGTASTDTVAEAPVASHPHLPPRLRQQTRDADAVSRYNESIVASVLAASEVKYLPPEQQERPLPSISPSISSCPPPVTSPSVNPFFKALPASGFFDPTRPRHHRASLTRPGKQAPDHSATQPAASACNREQPTGAAQNLPCAAAGLHIRRSILDEPDEPAAILCHESSAASQVALPRSAVSLLASALGVLQPRPTQASEAAALGFPVRQSHGSLARKVLVSDRAAQSCSPALFVLNEVAKHKARADTLEEKVKALEEQLDAARTQLSLSQSENVELSKELEELKAASREVNPQHVEVNPEHVEENPEHVEEPEGESMGGASAAERDS